MRLKKVVGILCSLLLIFPPLNETTGTVAPEGKYDVLETEKESHPVSQFEMTLFVDFYCPRCLDFDREILPHLLLRYGDRMKLRRVGLPVVREESESAIELYLAAERLGKGEEMKELLFKVIHDPDEPEKTLFEIIHAIGLPLEPVLTLLKSGEVSREIQAGVALANRYGVHATPGAVINGKYRIADLSWENLTTILDGFYRDLNATRYIQTAPESKNIKRARASHSSQLTVGESSIGSRAGVLIDGDPARSG